MRHRKISADLAPPMPLVCSLLGEFMYLNLSIIMTNLFDPSIVCMAHRKIMALARLKCCIHLFRLDG